MNESVPNGAAARTARVERATKESKVVVEVDPYASFGDIDAEVRRRIADALNPVPADQATSAVSSANSSNGSTRFGKDFFPTQLFGVVQGIPDVLAVPLLEVTVGGRAHNDIAQPVVVAGDQIAVLDDAKVDVRPRRDL